MTSLERSTGSRRLGWVSLVGVLLVPIMLAAGFLAATWNSSSRWHKIDAAVVNLDEPVKINGQTVPLGRQLAGGLVKGGDGDSRKADQNFAWVLTDSEDAGDGLADGRYAAVVTIPKDFSARATSYSTTTATRRSRRPSTYRPRRSPASPTPRSATRSPPPPCRR
jgi:putative membrane protein